MKSLIKKLLEYVASHDWAWNAFGRNLVESSEHASRCRRHHVRMPSVNEALDQISPDLIVQNGPFSGMKYPSIAAAGSVLFPKILGSYEQELHPIIEQICATDYDAIIDVGCAEGYYAVGLAMKLKNTQVYAYDIDEYASSLCENMAKINGLTDRISMGKFCSATTIMELPLKNKSLIICDCEGYEKQLFTRDLARYLSTHDILIEVHDLIDLTISSTLREIFESTHNIEIITSINDIQKAHHYKFSELDGYDIHTRKILLAEGRHATMEWFFITPRQA